MYIALVQKAIMDQWPLENELSEEWQAHKLGTNSTREIGAS
jgi:hypothetical protein